MKKYSLILLIILVFAMAGCTDGNGGNNPTTMKLIGTKWKLVGFYDVEKDSLKEVDPKDCGECYTLEFNTDSIFSIFSSVNELRGEYIADYNNYSFQIIDFGGTKVGEYDDGNLYAEPFWNKDFQIFSLRGKELKLFYNGKKDYLLFKLME